MQVLAPEEAEKEGFATFSKEGEHIAIEIPDGINTITVKTSEGKKITFCFLPYFDGGSPQCVDIRNDHNGEMMEGHPLQDVRAFSLGTTPFSSEDLKESQVTLTSVVLL